MKTYFTIAALAVAAIAASILISQRDSMERAVDHFRFTALGDLPGGSVSSAATSISADGSVVVGSSNSADGPRAFRWTAGGGMAPLPLSHAHSVSSDGNAVVGYRTSGGHVEPVRWLAGRGLDRLVTETQLAGAAQGVSADGLTVVGTITAKSNALGDRDVAVLWHAGGEALHLEPRNAEAIHSEARAVSADGRVIVGGRRHHTGHEEAFRWTRESGAIGLGVLPGHLTSTAVAVSADGSVVVGTCSDYLSTEAFRWTKATGMIGLGALPGGGRATSALAVSADGADVVGSCGGASGPEAFVWDREHGVRSIRQILVREFDLEDELAGWKLLAATAVSAEGAVIVGFGVNPAGNREAWIARFGEDQKAIGLTISNQLAASRFSSLSVR